MFGIASSQVFIDSTDATRLTLVSGGNRDLVAYTQKTLFWEKNQHIVLSKNIEGNSIFTLIKDNNVELAENITLDSYFNVSDFDIEGSTLYFCGNVRNGISTEAFIAYADINHLFFPSDVISLIPLNIKYTLINNIYQDSIFSIDRIEVFKNATNTVVAGIGKMYYGNPPYTKIVFDPLGTYQMLVNPNEYYLDFFMLYTITEDSVITNSYNVALGDSPTYATANDFEMFYVANDTINNCYYNKFADITETKNKIYLTSINYSNTNIPYPTLHAKFIDLISFDKLTRQQTSGRIHVSNPIHQSYGVKTSHIIDDEIAIVYNACFEGTDQVSYALRVKPDIVNIFDITNISKFDSIFSGCTILDCDYLEKEEELVVLKKSLINSDISDLIFHLNMKPNISYPYYSYKYKIFFDHDVYLSLNDINNSNSPYYTISGYSTENNLLIFDAKNESYLSDDLCHTRRETKIDTERNFEITAIPNLKQCTFYNPIPYVDNNTLSITHSFKYIYDALLQKTNIPNKYTSNLLIKCIK